MNSKKQNRELVNNKITKEYIAIMKDVILNGYEWKVPGLVTFKIVKLVPPIGLNEKGGNCLCVNGTWYKLQADFENNGAKFIIKYKAINTFKNQVRELIKNNVIDYRVA
jgi:hypothetical protein